MRCLLNHDPSQVLGRSRSGTLRLSDEQRGLKFECASIELRTRPTTKENRPMENNTEGDQSVVASQGDTSLVGPHSYRPSEQAKVAEHLTVEDRSAAAGPTIEERVEAALRSIRNGSHARSPRRTPSRLPRRS